MSTRIKSLLVITLVMLLAFVLAGCGSSQKTETPHNTVPTQTTVMPNEDPLVFIKEMQQQVVTISEQTKLNKLEDAKKAVEELLKLNDKLAVHITDSKRKEDLGQVIMTLQTEVQKQSPSQSDIDKQIKAVKILLNETDAQMKSYKHM